MKDKTGRHSPLSDEEKVSSSNPSRSERSLLPIMSSNLTLRLFTACILIPPLMYVIYRGDGWLLSAVLIITVIGLREFYQLIEQKGATPVRSFGFVAGSAFPVLAFFGAKEQALVLLTLVLLLTMVVQLAKSRIGDAMSSISGTFFGVFYIGWLLSYVITLRNFQEVVASTHWGEASAVVMHPDVGGFYLVLCIASVVAGDAGAYFTGRNFGRNKLAPRISPAKTVEGVFGAVIAGTVVGAGVKLGFDYLAPSVSSSLSIKASCCLGFLVSIVGIIGDLVESLLKRDAQVKDTGTLLPGTGGILDRIDSNLLAIPVMYYLLLLHTYLQVSKS